MLDPKLTKIGGKNQESRPDILEDHNCYYLLEYTAGKGYSYSSENSHIFNLKKRPSGRNAPGYFHKGRAIRQASEMFAEKLNIDSLKRSTLVPIPGSKIEGDPDYDDRMERVCRGICPNLDVRALVKQKISTRASHSSPDNRITLQELLDALYIDESLTSPEPAWICVFDDVLAKGTHFRAMHQVLSGRFPNAKIWGFFIAIAVH